jgi:hypothetical protein
MTGQAVPERVRVVRKIEHQLQLLLEAFSQCDALLPVLLEKGLPDEAGLNVVEKYFAGQVKNVRSYVAESIGHGVGLVARELLELVVPCRDIAYDRPNVTTRLKGAGKMWRVGAAMLVERKRLVCGLVRIHAGSRDGWR